MLIENAGVNGGDIHEYILKLKSEFYNPNKSSI